MDTIEGKGWQDMLYVGVGFKNNKNNLKYQKAIFVLNNEIYHQFHTNWQYSMALSYRKQERFDALTPQLHDSIPFMHEFRVYGRFSYIYKYHFFKLIPTFRQELRNFYLDNLPRKQQLRTRFRLQAKFNLDKTKSNRIILGSEQFWASNFINTWQKLKYSESRFTAYYSYSPQKSNIIINLGYMLNTIGLKNIKTVNYLAFDIIWENPFGLIHRNKDSINENLE